MGAVIVRVSITVISDKTPYRPKSNLARKEFISLTLLDNPSRMGVRKNLEAGTEVKAMEKCASWAGSS